MLRRLSRFLVTVGVLAAVVAVLAKVLRGRAAEAPEPAPLARPWPRLEPDPGADERTAPATTSLQPDPDAPTPVLRPEGTVRKVATKKAPAKKTVAKKAPAPVTKAAPAPVAPTTAATTTWVEPTGDVCPTTHPVKAKLSSKIFHLPGMLNYDRTRPDRCYSTGEAAEGDGLRPAKR